MRAIILAAGRGSRLGVLTEEKPKALVEFNGRSLIDRATASLHEGGVTEIGIVTGYRGEMLKSFADRTFINPNWNTTGIFESLTAAISWLSEAPCIVSYGDIFYSPKVISGLIKAQADIAVSYDVNAVSLWSQRFGDPLLDLERFKMNGDNISVIGGRGTALEEIEGQYMGTFKLTPTIWDKLLQVRNGLPVETRSGVDMTSLFAALIGAGCQIAGIANVLPWGEIDTPSDIRLYEEIYPDL